MTNEKWLNTLSTEEKAKFLVRSLRSCNFCIYDCVDKNCLENTCENGIKEWLKKEHKEPMPELKEGDCIFFREGSNVYRAMCVHGNIVYCIENARCHIFDGKLKEDTFAIKRYKISTGTLEDIWRADNER